MASAFDTPQRGNESLTRLRSRFRETCLEDAKKAAPRLRDFAQPEYADVSRVSRNCPEAVMNRLCRGRITDPSRCAVSTATSPSPRSRPGFKMKAWPQITTLAIRFVFTLTHMGPNLALSRPWTHSTRLFRTGPCCATRQEPTPRGVGQRRRWRVMTSPRSR